jgi:hypothetical protein
VKDKTKPGTHSPLLSTKGLPDIVECCAFAPMLLKRRLKVGCYLSLPGAAILHLEAFLRTGKALRCHLPIIPYIFILA